MRLIPQCILLGASIFLVTSFFCPLILKVRLKVLIPVILVGFIIPWELRLFNLGEIAEGLKLTPEISIPAEMVHFTIDSGGTWTAADGQGTSLGTGRIELARFINPAGLTSLGRNLYDETDASGSATAGNPGEDGAGTISQNFLEMSNVNVVDEMVKMIVGQRAYEINSKAIQTADAMLQMANSLKR